METTEYTLHKNFVKNDLHLLLCEDDIWNNWILIMRKYARGKLLNTKEEMLDDQKKMLLVLKGRKIQQATRTMTL